MVWPRGAVGEAWVDSLRLLQDDLWSWVLAHKGLDVACELSMAQNDPHDKRGARWRWMDWRRRGIRLWNWKASIGVVVMNFELVS